MSYDDIELKRRIMEAVLSAFNAAGETNTTMIVDALFVQLKPLVYNEQREYAIAQLRDLLTSIS
jgi:hypothetical protein